MVAEGDRPATVPAFGGSYVEGVVGGVVHLNPLLAETDVDRDVARLVFTGLTRSDREGEVVPDLAASVDVDDDGRVWTFEIRDDARWHDGMPVVADDVVYTVSLLQDPLYRGAYAEALRDVTVERVGTRVVRFTLPGAYGPFAGSTTFPLLPAHKLGGVPFEQLALDPFDQQPVGSGPFKLGAVEGRDVVLLANLDFYRNAPERTRPYLDRIVLRSYGDMPEALMALARGELDGVATVSTTDAERARALPTIAIYSYPTNDYVALFLDLRPEKPVFRERAVRQAIATAIDRGSVLGAAVDGRGRVADSIVPRTSWAYTETVVRYEHSYEGAAGLLERAGWRDTDGDGIRDKDGVSLHFTIATSDEPARTSAGRQITADLRKVGIQADLASFPFGELVQEVIPARAFDALLVGITGTPDPDPYSFFHSSQTEHPGFNFSGYSTLPMDRALEAARQTADRESRKALWAPVFEAISTEVPVVYLYFSDHLYAQHTSVKGTKVAQIVEPTQRFWDVEDWFVKSLPRR
ncbi:MAG: ABC transporter substrate-binding protein [Candidatus Limnocylindria bacterium]